MEELNDYVKWKNLNQETKQKLVQYYETKYRGKYFEEDALLTDMNEALRTEISVHNTRFLIEKVPFLKRSMKDGRDEIFFNLVANKLHARYFIPGDCITKQGDSGLDMFFILSGKVDVTVHGKKICSLYDGAYFGEVSLIMKTLRTATVQASLPSVLYRLTYQDFQLIVNEFPDIKERVDALAQKSAQQKENKSKMQTFASFCKVLDQIQRTKGHGNKKKIVGGLLMDRKNALVVLSLLLPHLDQRVLNIKEKVLARLYATALGIEGTADAARLLDWRNPAHGTAAADFAATLFSVVRDRIGAVNAAQSSIDLAHIDNNINGLVAAESILDRTRVVQSWIQTMSPIEHKWLARIILKEMKLGITEKTIFDSWHPEAQDLYNISSSLSRVATELADLSVSILSSSSVSLNFPFKPMLSKSVKSLNEVEKVRDGKTFWIETKLDGERMQLHKSDGEMMSYNVATGLFESFGALKTAANLFNTEGESAASKPVYIVFDILQYNGKSLLDSPLRDRYKLLNSVLKEKKLKLEILQHAEGVSTDDVVKALDASMVKHEEGIVIKNPDSSYLLNDRGGQWLKVKPDYIDSLGDDLDLVLVGGFYGTGRRGGKLSHFMCAVLDDSSSPSDRKYITFCKFGSGYTLSQIEEIAHENSGHWQSYDHTHPPPWFVHPHNSKEKPDMILHPSHSRIVTVKAAEVVESTQYGVGWTLRFPRFVCVRTDKGVEDSLTKVGLEEYVVRNKGRMQSRRFGDDAERGGKGKKDSPKKGGAARSVAVVGAEYQAVKLEATEKVAADQVLKGVEVCVIPGSVLSESGDCLKHKLEREILVHGGTCVQNPKLEKTTCVIADKSVVKVANLMREGMFDIVKTMWILDSIEAKERLPLEPRYMLFTAKETRRNFKKVNDRFGDSYSRDATVLGLDELFATMNGYMPMKSLQKRKSIQEQIESRHKQLKTLSDYETKFQLDVEPTEGRVFRNVCVYLDITETVILSSLMLGNTDPDDVDGVLVVDDQVEADVEDIVTTLIKSTEEKDYNSVSMLEAEIRCRGGQVANVLGPWTTHIVLAAPNSDYPVKSVEEQKQREDYFLQLLLYYPDRHTRRPNIVNTRWVKDKMELLV
ncbi:UNVERIFIED_CONTAM: DNA ligase (ATP) [Siphonaria sp. JEL0065]|nr:DNA ligase (ATP) [Siphonaria sp. JEL0065]